MKIPSNICFSFFALPLLVSWLAFSLPAELRAASIVSVTYSQNGKILARTIYTGRDGGTRSDPSPYWSLLGGVPGIVAKGCKIKPDQPGGKIATIKGDVAISVTIRRHINMGIINSDALKLVRNDAISDRWYLPEAEHKRVQAVVRKSLKNTVTVLYQQKYVELAQTIYFAPEGEKQSDPSAYWALLGKVPELVSSTNIKPDEPGGTTATFKGDLSIHVTTRPYVDVGGNARYPGIIEIDSLEMVRDDATSDKWHLSEAQQQRITALVEAHKSRTEQ